MKRLITILAITVGAGGLGFVGCAEKESAKKETTITTPGGKTTITTETEIEKKGKNPPPASTP